MSSAIECHLRDVRPRRVSLGAGQYLFHLGDPVRGMHIVQAGKIHLSRHQQDGSLVVLQKAGPGSVVAEASLYSARYHCDAVASTDAHVLAFDKADIQRRLRDTPAFAEAWARHLAHELQQSRLQAEILSLKTVAGRLDAWLAWRGGGLPGKGDWRLLASEIGVSPEALYREIARRRPPAHGTAGPA